MKEGYKKTEVGVIPEDWEVKTLKECSSLIKDGTHNPPKRVDIGIPMLSAENIFNGKVQFGINEKNISIDDYKDMHKNYVIEKGDILMTIVGTIGRVAQVKSNKAFTVQRSVAIIKNLNSIVNSGYLSKFLESSICKKELDKRSNSTAQAGLYLGELNKVKVIVPPLKEQEKIDEILSTVDCQIDDTEKLIEKCRVLKKGLMQRLLTKGIGHTEFKKSEVGEIPVGWEVKKMEDIIDYTELGTNSLGNESYSGLKLLKMGNITRGGFDFRKLEKIKIEEVDDNRKYILKYGDFLFNTRNTLELVGKSAAWKNSIANTIFNSNIMRIRFLENIDSFYMSYYFESDIGWKKLKSIATGTTSVAAIYTKDLNNIKVIIPSLNEQERIAEILLTLDGEIEEYENKKHKLEKLKKGLMQQLLTGKVRTI